MQGPTNLAPRFVSERELPCLYALAHLRVGAARSVKGMPAGEKDVQDDAEAPHVHLFAIAM